MTSLCFPQSPPAVPDQRVTSSAKRTVTVDEAVTLAFPPAANLVQNGNFEAQDTLSGWTSSGTETPGDGEGNTGDHGVRLGPGCPNQFCLTEPQPFGARARELNRDRDDHRFRGEYSPDRRRQLLFSRRPQRRLELAHILDDVIDNPDDPPLILIGPDGTIHTVVDRAYRQKPLSGVWSPAQEFPINFWYRHLAVDKDGNPLLAVLVNGWFSLSALDIYRRDPISLMWEMANHVDISGLDVRYFSAKFANSLDGTIYMGASYASTN